MEIIQNKSLIDLNTFGIDVRAKYYSTVESIEDLQSLSKNELFKKNRLFVLGGGSNILLTKNINSLVIKNDIKGIKVLNENEDSIEIMAGAGENWHQFVLFCVDRNYGGIENLSLIPGNIGAAPMQNIGAYGVEIKDTFLYLNAFHIKTGEIHQFNKDDCKFNYRESVFKNKFRGEYIILNVVLKLTKKSELNTSYGDIEKKLIEWNEKSPTIKNVSNAVISIRESKLPDPKEIGNSGSFFKNPIINKIQFKELLSNYPSVVHYNLDENNIKIAAGWLIDQAGWKGQTYSNYGVHKKQALVLVNYGGAKGSEIDDLSNKIIEDIFDKYKIKLEKEVNVI